jgi:hypothetical protein
VANHEGVGCSEHQSRLSKGVIAKVVQLLKLAARFGVAAMKKPPLRFHFLRGLSPGLERGAAFRKGKLRQQRSTIRQSGNGTGMVAFVPVFCDWNCIYFQSSKSSGRKRQVFAWIPDVAVTWAACTRICQGGTKCH